MVFLIHQVGGRGFWTFNTLPIWYMAYLTMPLLCHFAENIHRNILSQLTPKIMEIMLTGRMEPKMNPERDQSLIMHHGRTRRCCWCARPSLSVLQHWLYIMNGQGDLSSSVGHATSTGRCSDQWRSRRYRERLISWTLANISWDALGYIDIHYQ